MAFTGKLLADGQLPTTKGTLYTVPVSTTIYVKFFRCINTGSGTEVVKIYINASGTSRQIANVQLSAGETLIVIDKDDTLILEAGDLIEGITTSATTVDYVISGVSEA